MNFIGIDIGTTSVSGVVLDLEKNEIVYTTNIKNNSWVNSENDWERIQDVKVIINIIDNLLDYIITKYPRTKGIGITGQMHGILYLNNNGDILSPLYTWQDGRGKLLFDDNISYLDKVRIDTGYNIYSGYGLLTHFYNIKNNLVPKETRYLTTISDYIAMRLSNNKKPVSDCSNAHGIGFFNLKKLEYDYASLNNIGIKKEMIPEVIQSGARIGFFRERFPIICAIGDNQASILGSNNNIIDSININIGTGAQISIFSDKFIDTKEIELRPYLRNGYLIVGAALCGGSALTLLERFFKKTIKFFTGSEPEKVYDYMEKVGFDFDENSLKVNTRFEGTRENNSLRGSIENISINNFSPEEMIVGFQMGIVIELYNFYKIMENYIDYNPKQIIGAGNGLRKNKLLQMIIENIFKLQVKMASYIEESAVGAALSAAVGLGYIKDYLSTKGIIHYQ